MTDLPNALSAYVPNVGRTCVDCGRRVVEAVEDGEPFVCPTCAGTVPEPIAMDDLTRAALEDTSPREAPVAPRPTAWRTVVLLIVAIGTLALVLGRR